MKLGVSFLALALAVGGSLFFADIARADEAALLPPVVDPPPAVATATVEDEQDGGNGRDEEGEPKPFLALLAGGATATISMGAGVVAISRYKARDTRNGALLGMQTGLTFTPLFAHMAVGETKRGLWFSLIPFVGEVGMATLMSFVPNLITLAPLGVQYGYVACLTASVFGAALGTLDAVRIGERTKKSRVAKQQQPPKTNIQLVPTIGGAMLQGNL